uniref:Uncharacterized protein n=1 Tax=Plectus sambesii TaxID=2011161 RepID=A0A914WDC1_9BILA
MGKTPAALESQPPLIPQSGWIAGAHHSSSAAAVDAVETERRSRQEDASRREQDGAQDPPLQPNPAAPSQSQTFSPSSSRQPSSVRQRIKVI